MTLPAQDIVERLRKAMDGVTPGKWERFPVDRIIYAQGGRYGVQSRNGPLVADCGEATNTYSRANAVYIALCSPDNIGALLDTISRLAADNEALRKERDEARRKLFPYAEASEISGYSTTGIYLIGDRKSIKAAEKAFHYSAQIEEYRTAFKERLEAEQTALDVTQRRAMAAESRADALAQEVERTKQNYVDANEAHLDCIRTLERIADARMPGQARRLAVEQLRLSKAIVAALANEEAGL